ncbi:hypothetical protein ILUMI_25401 [Ignelater luminosus]|uniref:HAT C-terminal dimerisation domain-containing protein n=1 Tax=Ignelater luminosus TaxID=2038154 RepID=A0A8K0CA31_IGNLU|nr:hypothetical protein ILUMI_25401 [Ignelater luminosus]
MKKRGQAEARIDSKLFEQLEDERKYWRNVLLRVVVAVKSLATRGLSFRGKTDRFRSSNNGNFMMLLEAISEFDPADSTPDITNVGQLSLIVRFVQDNAEPVKRFLWFLPNTGHKAEDMLLAVMDAFKTLHIDNCRGQSHDNASNMSGQYNGLQAKIKDKYQYATYGPCAAHSLNLIGSLAAECCPEAIKFFELLQNLYKKSSQEYRRSHKRVIKRKKRGDEYREGEVLLLGRDHFRVNTFFPICDQLLGKLKMRKTPNFAFLCKLDTMSEAKVRVNAINLQKLYPFDLANDLQEECVLLKQFLTSHENKISLRQLNLFIKQKNLKEAFSYTEIALHIFLCTAVTNCSTERSFSVLKKIKDYLHSRISEERLNSLAILNIEADLTKSINCDSVIDEFVNRLVHRKKM